MVPPQGAPRGPGPTQPGQPNRCYEPVTPCRPCQWFVCTSLLQAQASQSGREGIAGMSGHRWRLTGSLALVGLLTWLLAGAIQPVYAQDHGEVTIVDFAFEPATIEVSAGATVSWTNTGEVVHTVTADNGSFNSGEMNPGATVTGTFNTPGTFTYHCSIHPDMTGTLVVTDAESAPSTSAAAPATDTEEPTAGAPTSETQPVIEDEAASAAPDKAKAKDAREPSQPEKEAKLGKVAGVGVGTGVPRDYTLVILAGCMALLLGLASRLAVRRI